MSENTKKMLSLFMAVSMVLSMMPMGVSAQGQTASEQTAPETIVSDLEPMTDTLSEIAPQSEESEIVLELGVEQDVVITETYARVRFSFTPAESGVYHISSAAEHETLGYLYDSNWNHLQTGYGYSHEGNSFQVFQTMEAGTTYYLEACYWSDITGTFQVLVERSPLQSITFTPISVIEGTNGYIQKDWNPDTQTDDLEYYYYNTWALMQKSTYTATFTDGTVLTGSGDYFRYNGDSYNFSYYTDQSYSNPWTAGNSYNMNVEVMGIETQFSVTITASPLQNITFTPVSVAENTNGYISREWNPDTQASDLEYYRYEEWRLLEKSTYTATFTDGTVVTGNGYSFTYNGVNYEMSYSAEQGYAKQWTVGNTYYIDISIMGQNVQVPVTITTLPLESLTFTPVTIMEGTNGNSTTEDDTEYFRYSEWNLLYKSTYTATFTDGTVITNCTDGFTYDGEWYSFDYTSNQSATNQWTPGNTYCVDITVAGKTYQIPVSITASPLQSITFTPITVIEGSCGSTQSEWNPDTGDYDLEYFYYQPWELLQKSNYTATFTDGTTQGGSGSSSIYYDGEWYSFQYTHDQGYDNQWTVGNTYYIGVSVLGQTVQVPVTIVPSPVVSFTVEPVTIIEGKNGSESSYWPGDGTMQTYYTYHWRNKLSYTVTFNDGTSVSQSNGNGFEYNGEWYSVNSSDNQGYENQWTVGNTYTGTASVMGVSAQVAVTIEESPIASVTFDPVIVEENKDGYWSWDNETQYFNYSLSDKLSYTVTFKDGTVKSGSNWNSVEYNGEYYGIDSYSDYQSGENPWLVGNTYIAKVSFEGKPYDVYVSVCKSTEDNGYTYLVQDGKAIINGCTLQTEILQIPEIIDGYPVVGITSLGEGLKYALEIRVPDSVTMLSTNFLKRDTYENYTLPLRKLTLGSGIAAFSVRMLQYTYNLEHIDVAAENPYLCSIDGVVYDKAITTLVAYPPAKLDLHKMPDTVTDASILFELEMMYGDLYANVNVQFGAGISDYKMVDGVIYNPEMTTVIKATAGATGSYVMPDTVEEILEYAFAGSNLTSVTVSPSVTYIAYASFADAINLEEITIPPTVTSIGSCAFSNCDNLKKVHISDLTAWSEIWFFDNPLWFAHDLYLNGELVKDLVFPETVAEGVYGGSKINFEAFRGGSFETVTIPSRIVEIGHDAFADCENLKEVHITDLGAWSGTLFGSPEANPLYYAHDLYLNGELVKDLVLTETVADRVYGYRDVEWGYATELVYGVNKYAFYNASIETVTVPEMITAIKDEAFEGCEDLARVNISDLSAWCGIEFETPSSNPLYYAQDLYLNGEKIVNLVLPETEINDRYAARAVYGVGDYTFYNINIESLTVPEYVYKIGEMAFYGSSVESIKFEDGCLDSIGTSAFEASGVKSLALPESLDTIQPAAFKDCTALQTVTFGSELHSIEYEAFRGSGLKSVELPDSLTYLGSEVFADCKNLESVEFGNTLNSISYRCFYNTGLKKVALPKQIEFVDSGAFENSALTELIINCEALEIYYSAFANCSLGDLDLGDNVKYIGTEAFAGNNATQIKLPASVTEVSYRVYAFNENLVSVTVPDTITYIDDTAFEGSNNLSHVLYTGTREQWEAVETTSRELLNATLHCEANGNEVITDQTCTAVTYYCSICKMSDTLRKGTANHTFDENVICTVCGFQGYWEYEVDEDAGTVTVIGYTGPEINVVVPDKIEGLPVTAFTREVFAYNRQLRSVVLPETITEIPAEAFSHCSALWTVTTGDAVTTVGDKAFYECEMVDVYLPDTVKSIGDQAFDGAYLYNFKMPKSVTHIGEMAFSFCNFSSVEIPAGVTEIAYGAFANCHGLQEVTIPDTVTSIGYYAFMNCGIVELTIPVRVKQIQASAFQSNNLETVVFLGSRPEMNGAFDVSGITMFYAAGDRTWNDIPDDDNQWIACKTPKVIVQPQTVVVASGETATVSVEGYGQRLSYQWYYAEPGAKKFTAVGGDSVELSMEITKQNTGGRAYCVITDVLGQSVRTDTVFMKVPARANGIRLKQLPYTREYDMRQELRTRGLEVVMTYDDNSEEAIFDYTVTGYDPNTSGEQTLVVSYGSYTATFTVTVNAEKMNFANVEEKIEISAPVGAVESNVELVVEKIDQEEQIPELPEIPEVLLENESVIFDITLEKEGEVVQPTETVRVSIPVPEHMESKRCRVYHISDEGHAQDMNAHYKDGRMVFDTNHFSYYAVVEVSGVTVSGTVSGAGDIAGTVVRLLSGGEVLETVSVSKNGTYLFENVVANDYVIEAVQEGLPAKQTEMTIVDQDVILDILLAILGDVDGDDTVTRNDAIRVLLYVLNPARFPLDAEADFDGDTTITRNDAIRLLLYVLNPTRFPLGE